MSGHTKLAEFIQHRMQMFAVYQPVMIGLLLDSDHGVVTEEEASRAFRDVLDEDRDFDVRRYPGDVLIGHDVVERLEDGVSYRLVEFDRINSHERAALVELCNARLQVYLAGGGGAPEGEGGELGPGRVYVLTSPATPTLIKVGYTTLRAAYRARVISNGTGVPAPFDVYFESIRVPNAYQIEQEILRDFAGARPNPRKEFLEMRVLRDVLERLPPREPDAA